MKPIDIGYTELQETTCPGLGRLRYIRLNNQFEFVAKDIAFLLGYTCFSSCHRKYCKNLKVINFFTPAEGESHPVYRYFTFISYEDAFNFISNCYRKNASVVKEWFAQTFEIGSAELVPIEAQRNFTKDSTQTVNGTDPLMVFNDFEFGNIRIIDENGKYLFCGADAARALGYKDTVNALKTHCKEDGVVFCHLTDSLGREQKAKFISESNLYRLITHSKLPSAERFEYWVFEEVIPSIRRSGTYALPAKKHSAQEPTLEERVTRLEAVVFGNESTSSKPERPSYCLSILRSNAESLSASKIAKAYGLTGKDFNLLLASYDIQTKMGDMWIPNDECKRNGYVVLKVAAKYNYYRWTKKGCLFLYNLLKNNNILPFVERKELVE